MHEAVQPGLGRHVALELADGPGAEALEAGARRQAALDHPGVVPVYAAGRDGERTYVARRLVRGGPLTGARGDVAALVGQVASALETAHAAGLAHGRLSAEAVVVDEGGRPLLDRLVPGDEAAQAADRRALAGMTAAVEAARARRRRRRALVAGGAGAVVLGGLAAVLVLDDGVIAPAVAPGAMALGSALAEDGTRRDCTGERPGPASPSCTVLPLRDGRPLVAPRDGVVVRWAVRGARGDLALQVLRPAGAAPAAGPAAAAGLDDAGAPPAVGTPPAGLGPHAEAGRSAYVRVRPDGTAAGDVALRVRRGDRLALELAPGAGVGVRDDVPRAGARRWTGPLVLQRGPQAPDPAVAPGEVQLRVDLAPPGAAPPPAPAPRGPGREVARRALELEDGRPAELVVLAVGRRVAVELRRGGRPAARRPVPGADARGRLLGADLGLQEADVLRVRWRNPGDGPPVVVLLRAGADGLADVP